MKKHAIALVISFFLVSCEQSTAPNANTTTETEAAIQGSKQTAVTEQLEPNKYYFHAGINADTISSDCEANLNTATELFTQLEKLEAPYTVESTLKALDTLFITIDNAIGLTYLLNNVHPDETLQAAADQCIKDLSKLSTNIGLSKPIYTRLQQIDLSKADTDTQRYHLKLTRDFKRSGVDKDETTREYIRNLNEQLTALGQDFSKNIRSDVRSITLDSPAQLDGLPEDYIAKHTQGDSIEISTDYPDLLPFLRYAHDDAARKALYKEHLNRAYPINEQVLKDIISTRHELATTLGYQGYAAYATEILMVENPQVASDFIEQISALAQPRSDADYQQLLSALQQEDKDAKTVENWQKAYVEEKVRLEQYQVNTKQIRQYFQYDLVKKGIFQLVEDLFSVQIKPWQTDVWHDSVEAYEIWENGAPIGRFYLDNHPRKNKYKHAAHFSIQPGIDNMQLPVSALVCNFPGDDPDSDLMEHSQVETFLHEFGHLIHGIFGGKQQWAGFSGIATERDFVEAPSQMLEEWIWDYDTLSAFAINKDGEVIPKALVDKMLAARDFNRGTHIKNQMFYAALALSYYQTPPEELDLQKTLVSMQQQYSPYNYIEDTHFYANFGHLYGYSAAYYTYMWSEVIAADMLSEFKAKGMRNTELAQHYRNTVLNPGGSKDAADLVTDFLGRPSNFDAFVERLNQ